MWLERSHQLRVLDLDGSLGLDETGHAHAEHGEALVGRQINVVAYPPANSGVPATCEAVAHGVSRPLVVTAPMREDGRTSERRKVIAVWIPRPTVAVTVGGGTAGSLVVEGHVALPLLWHDHGGWHATGGHVEALAPLHVHVTCLPRGSLASAEGGVDTGAATHGG